MTSVVTNNFIGKYQSEIASTMIFAPLCFEGARFIYKVASQKNSLEFLKNRVIHLFKKDTHETTAQYRKRLAKYLCITLVAIGAMTFMVLGIPFLSPLYSISIALAVISQVGKAYCYRKEIKQKLHSFKKDLIHTYSYKSASTDTERKKVLKNYFITFIALASIGATSFVLFSHLSSLVALPALLIGLSIAGYLVKNRGELTNLFGKKANETEREKTMRIAKTLAFHLVLLSFVIVGCIVLPTISDQVTSILHQLKSSRTWLKAPGTHLMIHLEYVLIGLAHLLLAIRSFAKNEKKLALFHLTNALVGMFIPFARINDTTPRLHHDLTGLILSLVPMRSFKLLGACYTLDSLLYFPFPERPFQEHNSYDFVNVVLEHRIFPWILFTASLQKGLDSLHNIIEKQRKDYEEHQRTLQNNWRIFTAIHYVQNLGSRLLQKSLQFLS